MSESLLSSFFRKIREIRSENRWANSQPWQYFLKKIVNFHRNINLKLHKRTKKHIDFFCSNFPLLLIINRTKHIQYLLSTVSVYLVYCILCICLQYLHCPSAVGWSVFEENSWVKLFKDPISKNVLCNAAYYCNLVQGLRKC